MATPRELRCPECGRLGVPVECLYPPDRLCPYCSASYSHTSRFLKSLLLALTPLFLVAALFGVIFVADLQTAFLVFVILIAGLSLWFILVKSGQS